MHACTHFIYIYYNYKKLGYLQLVVLMCWLLAQDCWFMVSEFDAKTYSIRSRAIMIRKNYASAMLCLHAPTCMLITCIISIWPNAVCNSLFWELLWLHLVKFFKHKVLHLHAGRSDTCILPGLAELVLLFWWFWM